MTATGKKPIKKESVGIIGKDWGIEETFSLKGQRGI